MTDISKNISLLIGLTGPSGAGKTTVALAMKRCGCFVIDSDKVYKDILKDSKECVNKLCSEFGGKIKRADGGIDRAVLAKIVFSDKNKLARLNSITHPYIIDRINTIKDTAVSNGAKIVVIDAPLLIESGLYRVCDKVISVIADYEIRKKRIMLRDNISEEMAIARISSQPDNLFYCDVSECVFDGNLEKEELYLKVTYFTKKLLGE